MSATLASLRSLKVADSAGPLHPPGWSAHPSNQSPAEPSPDGPVPVLSFDALRSIASGLAWTQAPVPENGGDPASARSVRLIATTLYDVWAITWPTGSGLGPHDHGGARSVLHVVEGELTETFADRPEEGPSRSRVLRKGDSSCGEASFLHDLENRSHVEATSLHVYSPPLSDLTLFQHFSSNEQHRRTMAIPERLPRASSSELGFVKRHASSLTDSRTGDTQ
jgi:mannose-6-phosphate isomerase-like protein (cupin superfamily)